ncbi:MAG TPA: cysteine desulfurase [Candidatus Thermoplasmatota archaeon]|nr:cysteine desulfurase [Candidatus Thermoplasmatota archaeon]
MSPARRQARPAAPRRVGHAKPGGYDVAKVRRDFPALAQKVHGRPLVYLDNAATTQKPRSVIAAERHYYERDNANVHRGVHLLSQRATESYEAGRESARAFLGAKEIQEVVFTRGTTEAINLVAASFVRPRLGKGDEVLISGMEHHSNIVPWQLVCDAAGARLRVVPITDDGELVWDEYLRLLGPLTRMVSMAHVSNALGTVNPARDIVKAAHEKGVPVLLDGAQAAPHMEVDVQGLGCDFYAFSSHKVYGPTGIGILYGRREHLEAMPPYQGGGDMIRSVTFERTTYNDLPYKFEAGTPNIAGAVALKAALDYVEALGRPRIAAHEHSLLRKATDAITDVKGVRLIGTAKEKAGVLSFAMEGIHPHDVGTILDRDGIAIRTGHHCAQPVMERFGVPATCRASFGLYNTEREVEALAAGVERVRRLFA